ncbi:M23 family metallopeptidase [Salibacterium aidingense]|uniref:M23 family metallopeptidase n=1 Tax=Salibacterium aidingense TaxID=384933 RepID=UPI0004057C83|nr:M23 family metallopeptidase [Salibacterium aidingense]
MKDKEKQQSAARETKGAKSKLRKWSKNKWFWPAAYLSACAVLLGTYFLIQSPAGTDQAEEEQEPIGEEEDFAGGNGETGEEDSMPTASGDETMQMPVTDEESVDIIGYYYDHDAAAEEQQDALVYYNNMYYQNKGIDIAGSDGESFEVTAAATGEVVNVEEDEILGQVVDVKHTEDIVTSYSSLEDVKVEEGDTITQGSVLGMAAKNLYNSDAGVHAHFEIRKDGDPLNPNDAFHQSLQALSTSDNNEEELAQDEEANPDEDSSTLEEFPILDGDEEGEEGEKEKEEDKDTEE